MRKLYGFSAVLVFLISFPLYSQWLPQTSGTTKALFNLAFFDVNTGIISGDSSTILKTSNGGNNWISLPPPGAGNNYYADVYMQNANNIYLAQGYSPGPGNGAILYSTNGGTSWTNQLTTQYDMFSLSFINSTTGYAVGNGTGSSSTLYKTTNGSSWNPVSVSSIGFMTFIYFFTPTTGFITSYNSSNILRSTDAGLNWSVINTNSGQNQVSMVMMVDANNCYGIANAETFLKSTNGGVNWTSQSYGALEGLAIWFNSSSTGFMVCGKGTPPEYKITRTTNAGVNWATVMSGTGKVYWCVKFISSLTGWIVGTGGSILKTTNGGTVWINRTGTGIPESYSLMQNYPNPFNPVTTIGYQLPVSDYVRLIIYDLNGRELKTFADGEQQAGYYEIEWNASDYSSGVYFYKLQAGDYTESRKMILSR